MSALNRKKKVKYEKYGNEYRRSDTAEHRKRFENKDEHKCHNCNFMSKKKKEMGYHVARKHAQPSSKQTTFCPSCGREFPSYYSLQQHRRNEPGVKQRKLVIPWRT